MQDANPLLGAHAKIMRRVVDIDLIKGGKTVEYYNTAGASVGLQAGAQTYGYALFSEQNRLQASRKSSMTS